jgi:hypothetical protein
MLNKFEEVGISWNHREALQVTGHAHQDVLQSHVFEHVLGDLQM